MKMKLQDDHRKVLEYLYRYGPANTFKLSRDLEIDRNELIRIVKELSNKGLTKYKLGMAVGLKKEMQSQEITVSERLEEEKDADSKLQNVKREKQRLENSLLKKAKKIKDEIQDLQSQRNNTAQKLAEEGKLFNQIQKQRKEAENMVAERERSLRLREERVEKREEHASIALGKIDEEKAELDREKENIAKKVDEAIGAEKEKLAEAGKRLKIEKEKMPKLEALKEDVKNLRAGLEQLKKKIGMKKRKSSKDKINKTRPKIVYHGTTPSLKPEMGEFTVSRTENKESAFDENYKDKLRQIAEKDEEIRAALNHETGKPVKKIRVLNAETE